MSDSKIFVDTSAVYALLDRSDKHHKAASALWPNLLHINITLLTTNYVVSETIALLQNRIEFEAANLWCKDILGILDILWIDAETHERGFALWLNLGRRGLRFVDCVSFVTMHQHEIEKAFCFKPHFTEHGFDLLTESFSSNQQQVNSISDTCLPRLPRSSGRWYWGETALLILFNWGVFNRGTLI